MFCFFSLEGFNSTRNVYRRSLPPQVTHRMVYESLATWQVYSAAHKVWERQVEGLRSIHACTF
eukprot:2149649-Amphidinium_carterae.1